jgi:hypothetical protein
METEQAERTEPIYRQIASALDARERCETTARQAMSEETSCAS